MFFTSLWRTIKNSDQAGSGREDRKKDDNKVKKKNEFKNRKFLRSILRSIQIMQTERKTTLITVPSAVKDNGKKGLKLSKVRREKVITSNFQKRFN